MPKKSRPMPRGFVNNIILQSLIDGDKYGYEIIKEVEELTDGEIVLKQPSLYSSLKRFEARGFISSYWGDSSIGGRRHYYTITPEGRSFFEELVNSGEIKVKDIVYENVEEEIVAEQQKLAEEENDNVEIANHKDDGVANESKNTDEISNNNNLKNNKEAKSDKKTVVDVDSEDYNVFDLLESESAKSVDKETDSRVVDSKNNLEAGTEINKGEAHGSVDNEIEVVLLDESNEDEVEKNETAKLLISGEDDAGSLVPTALAEQTKLNLNEFVDESGETRELEKDENEIEFIEPVKLDEVAKSTSDDLEAKEQTDKNDNASKDEKIYEPIERAQTIVDEFGIKKSSKDIAPKRQRRHFDNVGDRRESKDPLYRNKNRESEVSGSKLESSKDASSTYGQKNFEETDRKITERIQKAVSQKFGKIESLDYKSLLGEVHFDEKEIEKLKLENDTIKLHDSYDENHFESMDVEEEVSTIKNTPYTALEDSLEKEGFKFKPYNIKFTPSKKRPEFLLSTKVGFYFGLIMFLIMIAQFGSFALYAYNSGRALSGLDKAFIYLSFAVAAATIIATTVPYILNRKKRKYNSFKMSSTLTYSLIVFISLSLLTYAINSFFGLTFSNVNEYIITLLLPIMVFSNLLIAPIVYGLLIINKKFY